MTPSSLAVLLDELLRRGGELQIKRPARLEEPWEAIVWEQVAGSRFPRAAIRIKGRSPVEIANKLEAALEAKRLYKMDSKPPHRSEHHRPENGFSSKEGGR